ncbi:hypothetical protein EYF80_023860 [Liparis tanakae]|uniref:Reverse transcriptase/retrotransposon-derived protein RNase H-like domain-containing protein n=1 Tax=Liparis tanakae TaxID=230148 RepID=A0A4Z2HJU3_9TELE|nr:hypothetical protein EYF80_023860 [Liparis tanakae]
MCCTPFLTAPYLLLPFKLEVDDSAVGAGVVLLQEDNQGIDHPVSYFSRKFNKHQLKYSTKHPTGFGCFGCFFQQTWNPPASRSAAQGNPEAQQSRIIETLGWGDMMDMQDAANPGRPDAGRFDAPWGPLPEREDQIAQVWEIPSARAAPGARRTQRHPPAEAPEDPGAAPPAAARTRPEGPPQGRPTGPLCDPGLNHGPIIAAHEANSASDRAEIIRLLTALGESKAVIHRLQVKLDGESRAALLRQIEVCSMEEELEDLRCRYRALSAADVPALQHSAEGPDTPPLPPVPPQDEAAWLIVVQFLVKLIDRLIADGYRKGGSRRGLSPAAEGGSPDPDTGDDSIGGLTSSGLSSGDTQQIISLLEQIRGQTSFRLVMEASEDPEGNPLDREEVDGNLGVLYDGICRVSSQLRLFQGKLRDYCTLPVLNELGSLRSTLLQSFEGIRIDAGEKGKTLCEILRVGEKTSGTADLCSDALSAIQVSTSIKSGNLGLSAPGLVGASSATSSAAILAALPRSTNTNWSLIREFHNDGVHSPETFAQAESNVTSLTRDYMRLLQSKGIDKEQQGYLIGRLPKQEPMRTAFLRQQLAMPPPSPESSVDLEPSSRPSTPVSRGATPLREDRSTAPPTPSPGSPAVIPLLSLEIEAGDHLLTDEAPQP